MISGIAEASKSISMNVVEKTDKVEEPVKVINASIKPVEAAPPVELNVSKGDW
jgi:hypothetical protein